MTQDYSSEAAAVADALNAVYAPLSHNHNSLYYTKAEVDALIGGGTVTTISLTADTNILSYYNSESATLSATVLENGSPKESATVEFFKDSTSLGTASTNSSGVATKTYASTGAGDVSFTASVNSLTSSAVTIEDCTYADSNTYTSDTSKDVSLPSTFKLEFDLYPKSRSTSSGGVSHYVRCTRNSATDIWFGQGTSSGSHGIMVRPSTNYWCTSYTVLNTDNHVVVTYDGSNVVYTCNDESKTVANTTAFSKFNGVSATSNGNLKNIKIKPL